MCSGCSCPAPVRCLTRRVRSSRAVASAPQPSGGLLHVEGTQSTGRAYIGWAIVGRGCDWIRCGGRRAGEVGSGCRGFGGRAPAAVGTLPPTRRGLSLVPPAVGAEPPRRSLINHRQLYCTSSPWCQSFRSGGLVCRDPAEPGNTDLGTTATLQEARSVAHHEQSPRPGWGIRLDSRRARAGCSVRSGRCARGRASIPELVRRLRVHRRTVCQALSSAVPPARRMPPRPSVLDPWKPLIVG
jgi:hypothetical protein